MQEYTSSGEVKVDPTTNLTTALYEHARTNPQRPALAHRVGDEFVDWTTRQVADEVTAIAKGFAGLGIEPGSKIAIMSETRLEWTLLDYAIWAAGCVTVPIYETSSAEQVEWILSDSSASAIVCSTPELKAIYDQVADHVPGCHHAFVLEEAGLEQLKSHGSDVDDAEIETRRTNVGTGDLATIVYTSGTTGRPKGCVITHGNFVWSVTQILSILDFFGPGKSTLLFLPLAHIFARIIQVGAVMAGVRIGYSTGIPQLLEELAMVKPDFLLAVPRVFEKVFNGAQQRAHAEGKGAIFDRSAETAIEYSRELDTGRISLKTRLMHALFDRLVYTKLRAAMGGHVTHAVSSGAGLGERLGHFYRGIGVNVHEAYGLTETTGGPATINRPDNLKIGTVGQPMPGVTVRIADDGEVLIRGGLVFQGYYNNDAATAEALTSDGWFRTGDIGQLDDEGFLRITGRKKEILVTAGGKNVAPAVLEDRIRSHFLVSQAMVVGDGEPFIAALVTIDEEALEPWAEAHGKGGRKVVDLVDDPELQAEVQKAIDEANQAVSKAESVRTFRILPEDFEVGVELSQKQSVKRHVVGEKYGEVIADIYSGVKRM